MILNEFVLWTVKRKEKKKRKEYRFEWMNILEKKSGK